MTEYTATTSNATNKVTATPTDEEAEVDIMLGDTEVSNGDYASWEVGDNELTVTVSANGDSTIYTIVVTKE